MPRDRKCSPQTRRVLTALLQESGNWRHGYEVSRVTGLKSGSVYPILLHLEARGLLESRWEASVTPGRPPRHPYRLTARGVSFAFAEITDLQAVVGTAKESA